MQPPQGLAEKVAGLQKLKSIADSRPKTVRSGRVPGGRAHAATRSTSACSRSRPAGRATRRRSSRCPAVITHDPRTGRRNVGMYRMQMLDRALDGDALADPQGRPRRLPRSPTAGWRSRSRSGSTRSRPTRRARRCRSTSTSSCSRASCAASRSSSCRAKTVDLEVPAHAEIVLEGYVDKGDLATRGRSATTPATTRAPEPFPVFHVTAMTMRRDAIYPSIVVGKPPPRTRGSARRPSGSSCRPCG